MRTEYTILLLFLALIEIYYRKYVIKRLFFAFTFEGTPRHFESPHLQPFLSPQNAVNFNSLINMCIFPTWQIIVFVRCVVCVWVFIETKGKYHEPPQCCIFDIPHVRRQLGTRTTLCKAFLWIISHTHTHTSKVYQRVATTRAAKGKLLWKYFCVLAVQAAHRLGSSSSSFAQNKRRNRGFSFFCCVCVVCFWCYSQTEILCQLKSYECNNNKKWILLEF